MATLSSSVAGVNDTNSESHYKFYHPVAVGMTVCVIAAPFALISTAGLLLAPMGNSGSTPPWLVEMFFAGTGAALGGLVYAVLGDSHNRKYFPADYVKPEEPPKSRLIKAGLILIPIGMMISAFGIYDLHILHPEERRYYEKSRLAEDVFAGVGGAFMAGVGVKKFLQGINLKPNEPALNQKASVKLFVTPILSLSPEFKPRFGAVALASF